MGSQFLRQNDRKNILYNPPFDGSAHRVKYHNLISSFINEGCYFGSICGWISRGFGPNGGLGSEDSVEKVSWKVYAKQTFFSQNPKIIFYQIFCLCQSRGEEAETDAATGWSTAAAEVCRVQETSHKDDPT